MHSSKKTNIYSKFAYGLQPTLRFSVRNTLLVLKERSVCFKETERSFKTKNRNPYPSDVQSVTKTYLAFAVSTIFLNKLYVIQSLNLVKAHNMFLHIKYKRRKVLFKYEVENKHFLMGNI